MRKLGMEDPGTENSMKPEYTVVWNNLGDQRYLSVECDTPRAPVQPEKRGQRPEQLDALKTELIRAA